MDLQGNMNALEDEQEFEDENVADFNNMFENCRMNDENLEGNRIDAIGEVEYLYCLYYKIFYPIEIEVIYWKFPRLSSSVDTILE